MFKFNEDEVREIYERAKEKNRFAPATDQRCNGTLFTINRMENQGVKLVTSPRGRKEEIKRINVQDFVDPPCIWIGEDEDGCWAGLQRGWPASPEDQREEMIFDSSVIDLNCSSYPNWELYREVEFMYLERERRSYQITRPGWLAKARQRQNLFTTYRRNGFPTFLAEKFAKEIEIRDEIPQLNKLIINYIQGVSFSLLKIILMVIGLFQICRLTVAVLANVG